MSTRRTSRMSMQPPRPEPWKDRGRAKPEYGSSRRSGRGPLDHRGPDLWSGTRETGLHRPIRWPGDRVAGAPATRPYLDHEPCREEREKGVPDQQGRDDRRLEVLEPRVVDRVDRG